jgi:hypothetical protein
MKTELYKISLFLLAFSLFFVYDLPANENSEFLKTTYELIINGEKHLVTEGNTLNLEGDFENPAISIKPSEYKTFDNGNITFDFPSYFTYESEKQVEIHSWTFSGIDYVIMYFEYTSKVGINDFIYAMTLQFPSSPSQTEPIKMELGKKTLTGKRMVINFDSFKIVWNLLEYEYEDDANAFIILQEVFSGDDNISGEEKLRTLEIIKKSIKFNN